jgi:SAM-dependent methyltransferase
MELVPGLVCARCHGTLQPDEGASLRCTRCATRFPIVDGIPSFVDTTSSGAVTSMCALSVVLPGLDVTSLERVLPDLVRALRELRVRFEVIVVDSGAQDGTPAVAMRHGARCVTQKGAGFGAALRAGLAQASGEYILTLDADLAHDPALVAEIWAARSTAEVIIASHDLPGSRATMRPMRSLLDHTVNAVFRRGLSLPVRDIVGGFRLYARRAIAPTELKATGVDILEEILIRCLAAGYRLEEIPYRVRAGLNGAGHASRGPLPLSHLRTFASMWRLRNSIASADYDARAYDSVVPLQRYWQRRRFELVTGFAQGFDRVLDVGCGSSRILRSNPRMVGLDIQPHKLRFDRQFGNPLVHGSIFALPFADASFDCVICSEVIEHVPADERAFAELGRVLKPGGRLILGTPDYDRWQWRALEWCYGKLAPGGYADEHITHYRRDGLTAYLQGRGFAVEQVAYVGSSEMIFSLRKEGAPAVAAPAVETALRAA